MPNIADDNIDNYLAKIPKKQITLFCITHPNTLRLAAIDLYAHNKWATG